MGVYIKGMEMPGSCIQCKLWYLIPLADTYEDICRATGHRVNPYHRADDCPLTELPPHGDLISREWLVVIGTHLMNIAKNDDIANGVKWLWQYVIEAPTVIEAEREE